MIVGHYSSLFAADQFFEQYYYERSIWNLCVLRNGVQHSTLTCLWRNKENQIVSAAITSNNVQ